MASKTSPSRLEAAEKRIAVLRLRRDGLSYTEIGERLGIHRSRAHQIVTEEMGVLSKELAETREELRQLELERLDRMHQAVWASAEQGNHEAIDTVLKLMNRRAKLRGLDAPTASTAAVFSVPLTDGELLAEADRYGIPISPELRKVLNESQHDQPKEEEDFDESRLSV